MYYYTNYYCYYFLLKEKLYIFPLGVVGTSLHGNEICLSSKTKMYLSYIKNLRRR